MNVRIARAQVVRASREPVFQAWIDYDALRAEAVAAIERALQPAEARPWPTDLVGTWDAATPRSKRALLEHFFDELDIDAGTLIGCKVRPTLAAGLADLISQYRQSSPGGIRTRDLSLERAAS